jgi:hypothetical protein
MLRTTIGEPRLTEVVENYLAMGFEVYVDRFATTSTTQTYREGEESCTTCFDAADRSDANKAWGSVYVRNGKPTALLNKLY